MSHFIGVSIFWIGLNRTDLGCCGLTLRGSFFHIVTLVSDNSNLSKEIFAIDTWGAVNMLFGTWSQAHAYDPSDYMATGLNKSCIPIAVSAS